MKNAKQIKHMTLRSLTILDFITKKHGVSTLEQVYRMMRDEVVMAERAQDIDSVKRLNRDIEEWARQLDTADRLMLKKALDSSSLFELDISASEEARNIVIKGQIIGGDELRLVLKSAF